MEGKDGKREDLKPLKFTKDGGNVRVDLNSVPQGWSLCGEAKQVGQRYPVYVGIGKASVGPVCAHPQTGVSVGRPSRLVRPSRLRIGQQYPQTGTWVGGKGGSRILVRGAQQSFDPRGALSPKFAQSRCFPQKLLENCKGAPWIR